MFVKKRGLHGSARLHADLVDDGWTVSEKTVADSMRRQGLVARRIKRRNGLTKQDKTAPKFPDLDDAGGDRGQRRLRPPRPRLERGLALGPIPGSQAADQPLETP